MRVLLCVLALCVLANQLMPAATPALVAVPQAGHEYTVISASFSDRATFVVTASADGTAILWDVATGLTVRRFQTDFNWEIMRLPPTDVQVLSGDKFFTASTDSFSAAKNVFDLTSGSRVAGDSNELPLREADPVAASPDGAYLLLAGNTLWDTAKAAAVPWFDELKDTQIATMLGKGFVITISNEGEVAKRNVATGAIIESFATYKRPLTAVPSPPNSHFIGLMTGDKKLVFWDTEAGREIGSFPIGEEPAAIAVNDTGEDVVTVNSSGLAQFRRIASGAAGWTLQFASRGYCPAGGWARFHRGG